MIKIKNILHLLIILLLFIITGCTINNNNKEYKNGQDPSNNINAEYQITCGIGLNEKSAAYKSLVKFKEIVENKSNGKITVDNYHSAELGDDREMMESLQQGYLEMTVPSSAPIVPFVTDFSVFDMPFLFPDYETVDYILDGPIGQELLNKLSDVGLKGLVYWENGYRNLTNNIRPVNGPEDVKDIKIRTMENAIHLTTWREMGARPTPMVFSELYSAMQQKVVDAQENPFSTIYLQKYYEVQKYLTDTRHVYTPFVLMMSQEYWDQLPNNYKKIIMEAAMETRSYNRQLSRKMDAEYLELLKDEMEVTILNSLQRKRFKEAVKPVYDEYYNENSINSEILRDVQDKINSI